MPSDDKATEGSYDHTYESSQDKRLNDVTVSIKDASGNVVKLRTTDSTAETVSAQTDTAKLDDNGEYKFDWVKIDELKNYHIEFEYDGKVYTTTKSYKELGYTSMEDLIGVTINNNEIADDAENPDKVSLDPQTTHDKDEHSKALESDTDRQTLDNKYSDVTGKNTVGESHNESWSEGYGYVRPSESLTYTTTKMTENSDAVAKYNQSQVDASDTYSAVRSSNYSFNKIVASTAETGYNVLGLDTEFAIRKADLETLINRNCGLIEREQVDLSVMQDLEEAIVTINGYQHTYKYDVSDEKLKTEGYTIDQYRIDVKTKKWGFTRTLYASDILYDENHGEDSTKMEVVYKMVVNNNSNTLSANITELANYHDSRLTITDTATVTKDENGNDVLNWQRDASLWSRSTTYGGSYSDSSYTADYTTYFKDKKLEYGESETIYVKYKLDNAAMRSVMKQDVVLDNVIEINGYTTSYGEDTYYHDGARDGLYASIDKDSDPGDIVVGDVDTYEDDTSKAPLFTITLSKDIRTVTGNVYEDKQTDESADEGTRLGNGIYDDGEGLVGNVKVELLCYKDGTDESELEQAEVYEKLDENGNPVNTGLDSELEYITNDKDNNNTTGTKQKAVLTTGSSGTYTFEGIIPDEYILRFTYSDGSVIYRSGSTNASDEGNTTLSDVNYYKSTIITSEVIKQALNNNSLSGDNSMRNVPSETGTSEHNITYGGTTYASEKWYQIEELNKSEKIVRYSDAVDSSSMVEAEVNSIYSSNATEYGTDGAKVYDKGTTSESGETTSTKYDAKAAYTGVLNIQVEYETSEKSGNALHTTTEEIEKYNNDGTPICYEQRNATTTNVDFGIIEKAKQEYEITKEITNIKLTLANGQILIDGDPRKGNLGYVKYIPENGISKANVEIDEELLYGSTLEITNTIKVVNNSEINYSTKNFYIYGTWDEKTDSPDTMTIKIIDYMDSDMEYQGLVENETGATQDSTSTVENVIDISKYPELEKYFITDAWKYATEQTNILLLTKQDLSTERTGEGNGTYQWDYTISRVLATADDLDFENDAETMCVSSKTPLMRTTPATTNGDMYRENGTLINASEKDNSNSEVILTAPTGEDKSNNSYYVIIVALVVLAGGVAMILKFVLRPKK